MTVQRAPDFLVAGRPGRAGADRKNEIMNSMDKSPAESHTDNEHRLQRLLSEHDLLKKFIATHLFIHIKEAFGFPPEKYHLVFRVDGLLQAGKSIESKSEHIVEILLPDDYPDSPPVCSMLSRIFHPNISGDRIDIKEEWKPETTLVDCVVKIGQMIVFQRYSIKAPLNKEAAQWTVQNNKLLPLSTIDFNRGADTAPSGPPAGAAAPVGAGRAADSKDVGDADTIIFEDAAAQLMKDKEPREDDTAQLSVEIEAPPAATSGKSGPGEVRPIPPTHPAKGVIPQHTQKKEPQAPAQQNRRFYGPENIPGEIAARKTAGYKVDNIFCVRCGMKNGIKADFCSRCGARLHTMMLQRMARMVIYVGTIVVLFLAAEVEIIVFLINP
jgi:ribosomal protein L40E